MVLAQDSSSDEEGAREDAEQAGQELVALLRHLAARSTRTEIANRGDVAPNTVDNYLAEWAPGQVRRGQPSVFERLLGGMKATEVEREDAQALFARTRARSSTPPRPEQVSRGSSAGSAVPLGVPRRWTLALDSDLLTRWHPLARGVENASDPEHWYFEGRSQAMRRIVGWLTDAESVGAPWVVVGQPGAGKSALLAHLAVLADPDLRRQAPTRYQDAVSAEAVGRIDLAIRATGLGLGEIVERIAAGIGASTSDAEALHMAMAARGLPFRLVVDAVDEARPDEMAAICRLLSALARDPRGLGVRVLVSIRMAPHRTPVERARRHLGVRAIEIDLDTTYADPEGIAAYVHRRLMGDPVGASAPGQPTPYRHDPQLGRRVASAVAARAGGNFLVAQLVSRYLAEESEPVTIRPGWSRQFPDSVASAMSIYLARLPQPEDEVCDILGALAFARSEGLPDNELWAAVASALSRPERTYTVADVHALLDSAATYLLEQAAGPVRRAYRLYHMAMDGYLRERCRIREPEKAVTQALVGCVPRDRSNRRVWPQADPYLLEHLPDHADAGNVLSTLLEDVAFLVHAGVAGMTRVTAHRHQPPGAPAHVYLTAASGLGDDPSERAAVLALAAQQLGHRSLAARILADSLAHPPWRPTDCVWEASLDVRTVLSASAGDTAAALVTVGVGLVLAAIGTAGGELTVHRIRTGQPVESEPGRPVHRSAVSAVAMGAGSDDRVPVVTAAADGTVGFWTIDDGLVVPSWPVRPAHDAAVVGASCAGDGCGVTVDESGGVRLWSDGDMWLQATLLHLKPRSAVLLSRADGVPTAVIAGTGRDGTGVVRVVATDGTQSVSLPTGSLGAGALTALDQHRALLTTGGGDVCVVSTESTTASVALSPALGGLTAVAVGSDGRVALGAWDGDVALVDAPEEAEDGGAPYAAARAHEREVEAVATCTDVDRTPVVVSVGADRSIVASRLDPWGTDFEILRTTPFRLVATSVAGDTAVAQRQLPLPGRATEFWTSEGGFRQLPPASGASPSEVPVSRTIAAPGMLGEGADPSGRPPARSLALRPHRAIAVEHLDSALLVATAELDHRLRLYEATIEMDGSRTGAATATAQGQPYVDTLALAPRDDGGLLLGTGGTDGEIDLWLAGPERLERLAPPVLLTGPGPRMRFVRGEALLVTGDALGRVRLFQVSDDGLSSTDAWDASSSPITAVAGHGRGTVVTGDRDGVVTVWRKHRGSITQSGRIRLRSSVLAAAFVDARTTVIWCQRGAIRIEWSE